MFAHVEGIIVLLVHGGYITYRERKGKSAPKPRKNEYLIEFMYDPRTNVTGAVFITNPPSKKKSK